MQIKDYKDLTVWQKSMDLVVEVYKLVKLLPKEETYALSDQMRRAVVSIPSNIAEGQGRKTIKEYINFLYIAQGSRSEIQTQLLICERLNYISSNKLQTALTLTDEVGKMLATLIKVLSENLTPNT